VIALLLLLAPFADAFWARDLGALQRHLAENRSGEQRALFEDMLKLSTCEPLEKLDQPDPLRSLVRVEEARRGTPKTLWDDLLRDGFFRRAVWNPDSDKALRWPDEEERWPAEVLLVDGLKSSCAKASKGKGPLALLTPELLKQLPPEPAARVAYERAVLLWRKGSTEGAATLDPALLDPTLRRSARFLRLEAKLDPPEGWVALAAEWPELAIRTRAAAELLRERRFEEVVRISEVEETPKDAPQLEMVRSLLWSRALAMQALGRDAEMLEVLARAETLPGSAQGRAAMRALAMSTLARHPFDAQALERFSGIAGLDAAMAELSHRALAAGNLPAAREAAQRLQQIREPRWRAEGLALAGEIAWVSGEPQAAKAALAQLFSPGWRRAETEPRDRAALGLAHAMALSVAGGGADRAELEVQLAWLRDRLSARDAAQVEVMLASLRDAPEKGEQPIALGQVEVVRPPEPPPAPALALDLPEPRSLLAIPAPDGSLRDWFDDSRGTP